MTIDGHMRSGSRRVIPEFLGLIAFHGAESWPWRFYGKRRPGESARQRAGTRRCSVVRRCRNGARRNRRDDRHAYDGVGAGCRAARFRRAHGPLPASPRLAGGGAGAVVGSARHAEDAALHPLPLRTPAVRYGGGPPEPGRPPRSGSSRRRLRDGAAFDDHGADDVAEGTHRDADLARHPGWTAQRRSCGRRFPNCWPPRTSSCARSTGSAARTSSRRNAPAHLTPRESECLRLVAQGYRDAEIARLSGLAATTVRFHLDNVVRKFGAANRVQAVAIAAQLGVLGAIGD